MTPSEIEKLLIGKQKYKMVAIFSEKKEEIYSMLSNVSQAKGICSPFIEVESGIMYFPQLTYSDVGFLKSLCDQRELKDYKIRLVIQSRHRIHSGRWRIFFFERIRSPVLIPFYGTYCRYC